MKAWKACKQGSRNLYIEIIESVFLALSLSLSWAFVPSVVFMYICVSFVMLNHNTHVCVLPTRQYSLEPGSTRSLCATHPARLHQDYDYVYPLSTIALSWVHYGQVLSNVLPNSVTWICWTGSRSDPSTTASTGIIGAGNGHISKSKGIPARRGGPRDQWRTQNR